jgi:hypothetical protein
MINTPTTPDILFKRIWQDLDSSMDALENGGNIDMATLDSKVRSFCDIVTKLPGAEAQLYNDKIADIIAHLTIIVNKLTERKQAVGEQIDGTNQRNRAATAYGATMLQNIKSET